MKEVIGFKVVDRELKNKSGFVFNVGHTYQWDKKIAKSPEHCYDSCNRQDGLCFTTKAINTLDYLSGDLIEESRFLMVKAYGYKQLKTRENEYCTKKMAVLKELTFPELLGFFDADDYLSLGTNGDHAHWLLSNYYWHNSRSVNKLK